MSQAFDLGFDQLAFDGETAVSWDGNLKFQNYLGDGDASNLANWSFDFDGLFPATGPYRVIRFQGYYAGGLTPRIRELRWRNAAGDIFPQETAGNMSSNTAPAPLVANGGRSDEAVNAWLAFDGSTGTGTYSFSISTDDDNWHQIDLGADIAGWEKPVSFQGSGDGAGRVFNDWDVQVSIDGVNFLTVKRVRGVQSWATTGGQFNTPVDVTPELYPDAQTLLFPNVGSYGKMRGMGIGLGLGLGRAGAPQTGSRGIPPKPWDATYSQTPQVVFSMEKVRTAYAGNCIRVRRSSDNSEQDIGFVTRADGRTVVDTDAILSFCGSGSGFVTTWYAQVGAGNGTQATQSKQPQIVSNGAFVRTTWDGVPFLDFTGGVQRVLDTGVNGNEATPTYWGVMAEESSEGTLWGMGGEKFRAGYRSSGGKNRLWWASSSQHRDFDLQVSNNEQFTVAGRITPTLGRMVKNGVEEDTVTGLGPAGGGSIAIGASPPNFSNGYAHIAEVFIRAAASGHFTTDELRAIAKNQIQRWQYL